jgi:hypothetical protein
LTWTTISGWSTCWFISNLIEFLNKVKPVRTGLWTK